MDMMNEQEYCKKLQEVFEFLLSSSCNIHDDTLYHKLLDSLNGKSKWNTNLLGEPKTGNRKQ